MAIADSLAKQAPCPACGSALDPRAEICPRCGVRQNRGTAAIKAIEIKDYIDATGDAAKRTRTVVIALVVASALIFGALTNSLQHQWMFERIHALYDSQGEYARGKILPAGIAAAADNEAYQRKYNVFYEQMVRSYVENTLSFKVPLFGFNVDVNDIGILGGLSFIIILTMYRFCLVREVDNLRITEKAAKDVEQFPEFYDVLAMRQVFTIPPSNTGTEHGKALDRLPRMICYFPALVQGAVTVHDIVTFRIGGSISPVHNYVLITLELIFLIYIVIITNTVRTRIREIDGVWSDWWNQITADAREPENSTVAGAEGPHGDPTA